MSHQLLCEEIKQVLRENGQLKAREIRRAIESRRAKHSGRTPAPGLLSCLLYRPWPGSTHVALSILMDRGEVRKLPTMGLGQRRHVYQITPQAQASH